eukprot:2212230-Pyramimonas_sp.AAC.1
MSSLMGLRSIIGQAAFGKCMGPAFQANLPPLKMWQQAVKQKWDPTHILRACVNSCPSPSSRSWDKVRGPAGAVWASLDRLGWRFTDWKPGGLAA